MLKKSAISKRVKMDAQESFNLANWVQLYANKIRYNSFSFDLPNMERATGNYYIIRVPNKFYIEGGMIVYERFGKHNGVSYVLSIYQNPSNTSGGYYEKDTAAAKDLFMYMNTLYKRKHR